jgi:menaquinone-dependent protoporphyrinogen IX oxidase
MTTRPPRVLVTAATRHGSTGEIAAALAQAIEGSGHGIQAVHVPVGRRPDPRPFDAVVLGSAVYAGRWQDEARDYATAHATPLRAQPLWLFSSGPIGAPPYPEDQPYDLGPLLQTLRPRGHMIFAGRLDKDLLSFGERAMVTAMRAPLGDFRDWDAIRAWATHIAGEVLAGRTEAAATERVGH